MDWWSFAEGFMLGALAVSLVWFGMLLRYRDEKQEETPPMPPEPMMKKRNRTMWGPD